MQAEQAIFTSLRSSTRQGYHLVARSSGWGEQLAQRLHPWCPSHGSLLGDDLRSSSLNSFSLSSEWVAVSRTVYGAPEYSGRGALQVVTLILAVRRSQFGGYDDNCVKLARTALALGNLRLPAHVPGMLPPITLPDCPLSAASAASTKQPPDDSVLDRSSQLLEQGQRVALLAENDPESTVSQLLGRVPVEIRRRTSFTTGLRLSQQRPFLVHIVPRLDADLHRRFASQGIRFVASTL